MTARRRTPSVANPATTGSNQCIQILARAPLMQHLDPRLASRYQPFADDRRWPNADIYSTLSIAEEFVFLRFKTMH